MLVWLSLEPEDTQMNTTDAEIAGIVRKLNGMKCGGAGITNQVLGFLSIYLLDRPMDHVTLGPKDLLAFCRAVVDRCDKPEHKHPERNVL